MKSSRRHASETRPTEPHLYHPPWAPGLGSGVTTSPRSVMLIGAVPFLRRDLMAISFLRMMGRGHDGAERGSGSRFHAVPEGASEALCGARPGHRSAGWSAQEGDHATCPRCLEILTSKLAGRPVG